jgi:acetyltransferase-like isoleucine patch superfamily enzyme
MKRLKRLVLKTKFHFFKFFIGYIVYINPRLYMKLYVKLLKKSGFKIIGTPRFIAKSARFDDFDRIALGDRLVISMNVHLLTHDYSYTTALIAKGDIPSTDIGVLRNISIGDNVFIGMNSLILPGTTIGDNVIIGAGSVVRGTMNSNSIYSGNPAKYVCDILDYADKTKSRINQEFNIDKN